MCDNCVLVCATAMCFVCLGQCLAVRRHQPWKPAKLLIGIAHLVWQFSGLFCLGSEYLLFIMYYLLQEKRADGMKEGSGTPEEAERTVRTLEVRVYYHDGI